MGLLNWFRSAPQAPSPPDAASGVLAMVLLEQPATLDVARLDERLRLAAGHLPMPAELAAGEGGAVTGTIPGGAVALMVLPVPVQSGDLEGPVALAWHWPEAATAVPTHAAHIIVHAASTTLDPVALRLVHTQLVAAMVEQSGARLKDGHTFGASAEDRRTVRVTRSDFLPETPVLLLEG